MKVGLFHVITSKCIEILSCSDGPPLIAHSTQHSQRLYLIPTHNQYLFVILSTSNRLWW